MLISRVMPLMSIYRLPHGQYGYKGHVINLPQDIITLANSLPRLPSELDILLVRKEESDNTHRDFRVRQSVMLRALKWLKQNKYYHDNEINHAALSQLLADGDLTGIRTMQDTLMDEEDHKDDDNPNGIVTFVPVAARKMTEQEAVRKSVQECQSSPPDQVVPWPSRSDTPINEFTTEGYMSCAFPILLPTGGGDFVAPR